MRYALIVANGDYYDPKLGRLRSPAVDAGALARVLHDPAIGGFEVQVSADEDEHILRRRLAGFFADRARDDLLLLHFSCHGLKDDSGQLYFAAADTEVDHLEATAISAEFVSRHMTRSRSRKVVALLDCCYSGAIARGLQFRAGTEVDVEDHLGGHGRVIITASSAMEYAFEGDELSGEGSPSVFTTAVVRGLESGEADRDHDHLISVDDLYDYVCEQVREVTPNQRPNMLSHLEGALYIARSSFEAPVIPAELPEPLVAAVSNPLAGVRVGAVAELAAVLVHGDPGSAASARVTLARLADDDSRRVASAAADALAHLPEAGSMSLAVDHTSPSAPELSDDRKSHALKLGDGEAPPPRPDRWSRRAAGTFLVVLKVLVILCLLTITASLIVGTFEASIWAGVTLILLIAGLLIWWRRARGARRRLRS